VRPFFFALAAMIPLSASSPGSSAAGQSVSVLLIGDSLSVGGFGDGMQESLFRKYGASQVAIFASCGSSPEDWLKGGFVTNCGYRQTTPKDRILHKYRDGKRPRPVKTPKLRKVLGHYRPDVAIVQQGTNWMDALAATTRPDAAHYRGIIRDFVREIRRARPSVKIFWVMPPSSSQYPRHVHEEVEQWINEVSRAEGFYTINSRKITGPYRDGRSGGDGVHYSDAAGRVWARGVMSRLNTGLKSSGLAPAGAPR